MSTRRRLSRLLLASHVGLVALFAALLLATGVGTVRSAVVGQARTEADRSVSDARQRLQVWAREMNVTADLLARQPNLRVYVARGTVWRIRNLVQEFHGASAVEYIQVQEGDEVVAAFGKAPPAFTPGLVFDRGGIAWRIVKRDIPTTQGGAIVLAEPIRDRIRTRQSTGLIATQLLPLPGKNDTAPDRWHAALRAVAASGEPETVEAFGDVAAARIARVNDEDGQANALLVASVAQDWVERRIVEGLAAFALSSVVTIVLALALAVLLAARIARPFAQVAHAAERLGGGDLDTPIAKPVTFLTEPVALAASLEDMRSRVATLTATERNQREELDAVLDGVDEGIVGIDADERIHYANRQFLELVGLEREQVLGLPSEAVLVPIERRPLMEGTDPALLVQQPTRYTPAGKARPLAVRRLLASGDRHVLVVREETALEAARFMRDRILANLSHEFQTPLSAQMASIELLRDHLRAGSDPVATQLAEAQFRGALRLSQLVENLLDSVRIESGEMRLRRQPVDLLAVVKDAVDLIRPLIDQREQRIELALTPGPMLTGDPQRLFSVLVNLLANANKFSPDATTIRVETQWSAHEATVWVEDEGPGLPPMGANTDLFAPFKRSPQEERSQRGTGLGLAIVYAIVTAHGGVVRVAPARAQRGARIGLTLPVGEGDAVTAAGEEAVS
ncbi:MAG: PAS domain-containing protein [Proteobacteria bacterium]|nr:PAS domain-containing protein [Pseudomonadota bacterium]